MRIPILLVLLLSIYTENLAQVNQDLVDDFARNFSYRNRVHIDEITEILSNAKYQPSIIEKISKPAEGLPWHRYRNIFMKDERIDKGVIFWNQYENVLSQVSSDTGIPPEIIVGILGVETYYGERKGGYNVLDALYTLSFGYPKRSRFFRSELEDFILLAKSEDLDIYSVKGSYAGAIGYSQFMPSSYEAYAVSYDAGGTKDLVNSPEDAIASVANYLKKHYWKRGQPIAVEAEASGSANYPGKQSLKPKYSLAHYGEYGYKANGAIDQTVTLLKFDQENNDEFWFGYYNFYVITRYNHSPLYAMAVFQLSEAIRAKKELNN